MNRIDEHVSVFLFLGALALVMLYRYRWRPAGTAFGTAQWMSEGVMRSVGMFAGKGLVIGRSMSGKLLHLPHYCHVLLVGPTGGGKGVSIIIPNLLTYKRGSLVCFDTKGDLFETTAKRREEMGSKIIRLAPFNGGDGGLNPLDLIPCDSPTLVDSARAMAESLVVRTGMENDPHWNDKSVQVITAILVLVLMKLKNEERSFNSVQDIASDPVLVRATAERLIEHGGIPGRYGAQLKMLFEKDVISKEGAGVLSTVSRHLSFLDSELVAKSVAKSTFDSTCLMKTDMTLFIQIPPDQLEAQKGLLRCWISTLIRMIGSSVTPGSGEVLFLIDEASALGSLPAIEEALVRGRSAGVRLLLAYQSDSQITSAFKGKPTLIYDNCTSQIYLGASSYETAERLSKSVGEHTQVVDSYGENESHSASSNQDGAQKSRGTNTNYSQSGRALLRPEEILSLDESYLIAFLRGTHPILAKRVKWYNDSEFNHSANGTRSGRWWMSVKLWWVILVAFLFLLAWMNR